MFVRNKYVLYCYVYQLLKNALGNALTVDSLSSCGAHWDRCYATVACRYSLRQHRRLNVRLWRGQLKRAGCKVVDLKRAFFSKLLFSGLTSERASFRPPLKFQAQSLYATHMFYIVTCVPIVNKWLGEKSPYN
jgi:hypothetical protein